MSLNNMKNYTLVQETELKDINSKGYLLKHNKSGARIALISNDDENKVFYIGFRTPPKDNTGLPHILEHSVLCGSKNFPAKDPFVELAKGSLNTFLNAMTYPDKTVYPIASCNNKDFQNLMHVYMDAVMYPNIYKEEKIFRQEGWHYELESEDDQLTYNGVVYNEMKGAFSSPEGVLDREILNSLCPDTAYGKESGGDPLEIPQLTYEDFIAFHKEYYHPSNSYIYLYGDMDMEERLEWLDKEYLSKYEAITVHSEMGEQKPFEKPVEVTRMYSIAEEETEKDNTYLSLNKVISTSLDHEKYTAFSAVEYALLTAPGAPLKQALLDAKIGKDVYGSYDNGCYYPMFSIVAKNANVEDKDRFLQVISDSLKDILEKGINKDTLRAGINSMEFKMREADFGHYPKGLIYGLQMFDSWLYDENQPFMHLEMEKTFAFLKEKIDTDYYDKLVQEFLVDNNHASVVIIAPEKGLTGKNERKTAEELAKYKESLSKEEIAKLIQDTKGLKEYQEEPSTKEDLEKIPLLERDEIRKEISPIINEEKTLSGKKALFHDVFTNGIAYIRIMFELKNIPEELLPYLGIMKMALGYMNTKNYTYSQLSNEINMNTGGILTGTAIHNMDKNPKEFRAFYSIKAKTLYDKIGFSMDMIREIVSNTSFDDEKRLYELLAQVKSRMHMSMNSAGHSTSSSRAVSYFSPSAKFSDMLSGMDFYQLVKDLEENFEERKTDLIKKLYALKEAVFVKENVLIDCTSTKEGWDELEKQYEKVDEVLYSADMSVETKFPQPQRLNEGFKTPAMIQYVACAGNFVEAGLPYTGKLQVLKVILGLEYFWNQVRVKGGAYGCMNSLGKNGDSFFVSYRDPNLEKTLDVYKEASDFISNFTAEEREMTKFIIGTFGNIDSPLSPDDKGARSLNIYLKGLTAEALQKERDEMLSVTEEDIRGLHPYLAAIYGQNNICVIGNEEKIKEQKNLFMEIKEF